MSSLNAAASRVALSTRHRGANHPQTISARQTLAVVQIEDAVERALAAAPALTDDQVERLAATLRRAGGEAA